MARSVEEIFNSLVERKNATPELADLNSTSRASVWRLFLYIMAFGIWTIETRFDLHIVEARKLLAEEKNFSLSWYRQQAVEFQYGFDLIADTDKFDNGNATAEDIEQSRVIKYAAAVETDDKRGVVVKIATETNDELTPVEPNVFSSVTAYFEEIRPAGVDLVVVNYLPDLLKLNIRIVIDALVLTDSGVNILTGELTVQNAIQSYMKQLPFNGELSLQALTDQIQNVEGVKDVAIDLAQSKWIDAIANDYGNFENIDISVIPESGYFKVEFEGENKSNLSYVV